MESGSRPSLKLWTRAKARFDLEISESLQRGEFFLISSCPPWQVRRRRFENSEWGGGVTSERDSMPI